LSIVEADRRDSRTRPFDRVCRRRRKTVMPSAADLGRVALVEEHEAVRHRQQGEDV